MTLALLFTPGWERSMRGVMGLFLPLLGLWKGINKKRTRMVQTAVCCPFPFHFLSLLAYRFPATGRKIALKERKQKSVLFL